MYDINALRVSNPSYIITNMYYTWINGDCPISDMKPQIECFESETVQLKVNHFSQVECYSNTILAFH
jgi:hypothetical protein